MLVGSAHGPITAYENSLSGPGYPYWIIMNGGVDALENYTW